MTFFLCLGLGFVFTFSLHYSIQQVRKDLSRMDRQLHAIAAGPSFVTVTRMGRRNVNAIKLVKDATGFELPETVKLLKETPCRIPFVFNATEATHLVQALTNIGVDASVEQVRAAS